MIHKALSGIYLSTLMRGSPGKYVQYVFGLKTVVKKKKKKELYSHVLRNKISYRK